MGDGGVKQRRREASKKRLHGCLWMSCLGIHWVMLGCCCVCVIVSVVGMS